MKLRLLSPEEIRVIDALSCVRVANADLRFRSARAKLPDILVDRAKVELGRASGELETALVAASTAVSGALKTLQFTADDEQVLDALFKLRILRGRKAALRSGPQSAEAERADLDIVRGERELETALRGVGVTGRSS